MGGHRHWVSQTRMLQRKAFVTCSMTYLPDNLILTILMQHLPARQLQRLAEALQLLCQAYDESPDSAVVLNLLAHHCLLRGDYDKVCASACLDGTSSSPFVNSASLRGRKTHLSSLSSAAG